ncbi:winged helix-turn-helix transcriptional regulator [Candidatus Sumerlaeota bacterium]|nr:winged helix-turn-helix transcriptional regulator [Candidatus Sumerlaeota bacterium]
MEESRKTISQKDRDLEMLEIIERSQDGSINQRGIARETRMALGLVNSCLRRLARKGLVKVKEAPGRRYLYYLTPKGFAEKSRLTYEYIRYSVHFYGEARERCRKAMEQLAKEQRTRIALIGGGDLAEIAYLTLQELGLEFAGLFDDERAGQMFFGVKVRPVQEAQTAACDACIYTGLQHPEEKKRLRELDYIEIFR